MGPIRPTNQDISATMAHSQKDKGDFSFMRTIQIITVVCALALLANTPFLHAGESGEWTIDDILTAESARSWTLSRDGTKAAWTKTSIKKIDGEKKRVSRLWLTRLASNESIQITRGDDSVRSPQFSTDGTRLAFITSRKRPGGGGSEAAVGLRRLSAPTIPAARTTRSHAHIAESPSDRDRSPA